MPVRFLTGSKQSACWRNEQAACRVGSLPTSTFFLARPLTLAVGLSYARRRRYHCIFACANSASYRNSGYACATARQEASRRYCTHDANVRNLGRARLRASYLTGQRKALRVSSRFHRAHLQVRAHLSESGLHQKGRSREGSVFSLRAGISVSSHCKRNAGDVSGHTTDCASPTSARRENAASDAPLPLRPKVWTLRMRNPGARPSSPSMCALK